MSVDHGRLSTYIIGVVVVVYGYLLSNPALIEAFMAKMGLAGYSPLVLSILAFTYDYFFPREESSDIEGQDGA